MIKVISLFSGIGAFEKALENLNIDYDLVGYCEIDKHASKSYAAIHGVGEEKNYGDITKIDKTTLPKDIDLITYGFPCQDISLAGKLKGFTDEEGNTTRSGLFFEALRIIEGTKPKIAIAENVKNLTGKRFKTEFEIVLGSLEAAGYNNYWKVLNAKDYGIPQNRERVFIVSIRKDIDHGRFKFPEPFPLEKRLKDMLETEVEEKYYLSDEAIGKFNICNPQDRMIGENQVLAPNNFEHKAGDGLRTRKRIIKNRVPALQANAGFTQASFIIEEPVVYDDYNRRVRADQNTIGTLTTNCGNDAPGNGWKIIVPEATKKGYAEAEEGDSINLEYPNSKTRRGRVGHGVAQTLTGSCNQAIVEKGEQE